MSIHPIFEKIKALSEKEEFATVLMIFIIVLVGLAGFGLGRLSKAGDNRVIKIEYAGKQTEVSIKQDYTQKNTANVADSISDSGSIVASKNGTKYYFTWCGGVGRIQDQNKVYFSSEKEALDAGYTKASGCN